MPSDECAFAALAETLRGEAASAARSLSVRIASKQVGSQPLDPTSKSPFL